MLIQAIEPPNSRDTYPNSNSLRLYRKGEKKSCSSGLADGDIRHVLPNLKKVKPSDLGRRDKMITSWHHDCTIGGWRFRTSAVGGVANAIL